MTDARLRLPLVGQLVWIAGCIAWNVAGVALVSQGGTGIGPTASIEIAAVSAVLGLVLYLAARRSVTMFGVVAALCAVAACAPVYQAITGDPSLWPSPFWRWAGEALNSLGILMGLVGAIRSFSSRA